MSGNITYHEFESKDFESLLKMSLKLWKDFNKDELQKILRWSDTLKNQKIMLAKDSKDNAVGFTIVSIRADYVEGAEKSPTGYLEGIYIEPDYRNQGIARELINRGEQWLKQNNCTQIGSDTWLTDKSARAFHQKLGFRVEDELVHFLKDIT